MEKVGEYKGVISEDGKSITFEGLPADHKNYTYRYVITLNETKGKEDARSSSTIK